MSNFLTNEKVNEIALDFMEKLNKKKYQGPYVLNTNQQFSDLSAFGKIATGSAYTDVYLKCTEARTGLRVDFKIYPQGQ